jgi:hypothetical protein
VLATRRPASLRVCALLDKRARRIVDVPLSYVGFEVPDVFVVGYGLDLDERERGRGEILAVDDLAAVRRDPTLLDLAGPPHGGADLRGTGPAVPAVPSQRAEPS